MSIHTLPKKEISKIQAFYSGHKSQIYSIKFSPDQSLIASGGVDKTIKLWDSKTLICIGSLTHSKMTWINSIAFSPDGKRLVSGGTKGIIGIWDIKKQECFHIFSFNDLNVKSVSYSTKGKQRILIGGTDLNVRVINAHSFKIEAELEEHTSSILQVIQSPDGKYIASASADSTFKIWDSNTYKCLHTSECFDGWVFGIQFSDDMTKMVTCHEQNELKVWETKNFTLIHTYKGSEDTWVLNIKLYPNGEKVIMGLKNGVIKVYNLQNQKIEFCSQPHSNNERCIDISQDGQRFISANDVIIREWDAISYKFINQIQGIPQKFSKLSFSQLNDDIIFLESESFEVLKKFSIENFAYLNVDLNDGDFEKLNQPISIKRENREKFVYFINNKPFKSIQNKCTDIDSSFVFSKNFLKNILINYSGVYHIMNMKTNRVLAERQCCSCLEDFLVAFDEIDNKIFAICDTVDKIFVHHIKNAKPLFYIQNNQFKNMTSIAIKRNRILLSNKQKIVIVSLSESIQSSY